MSPSFHLFYFPRPSARSHTRVCVCAMNINNYWGKQASIPGMGLNNNGDNKTLKVKCFVFLFFHMSSCEMMMMMMRQRWTEIMGNNIMWKDKTVWCLRTCVGACVCDRASMSRIEYYNAILSTTWFFTKTDHFSFICSMHDRFLSCGI